MLDCTVLQSAGALEERISLVQKKRLEKRYCCKHLFDEFDPKHHVQRYVRDPQATPHSISKACKNKEQCIAVCAFHSQFQKSLSQSLVLLAIRHTGRANSELSVSYRRFPPQSNVVIELTRHHFTVGFEPTTRGLRVRCYTKLSYSTIAVGAFQTNLSYVLGHNAQEITHC